MILTDDVYFYYLDVRARACTHTHTNTHTGVSILWFFDFYISHFLIVLWCCCFISFCFVLYLPSSLSFFYKNIFIWIHNKASYRLPSSKLVTWSTIRSLSHGIHTIHIHIFYIKIIHEKKERKWHKIDIDFQSIIHDGFMHFLTNHNEDEAIAFQIYI